MKSIENYIKQIKNNEDIENYLSSECDVDFESKEDLKDDLDFLMEGAKCNYELTPFACDTSGGIYTVLDNSKIEYIDSEYGYPLGLMILEKMIEQYNEGLER